MATTRRRKSLSIIAQLTQEPYRFDFYQAVRLIERAALLDNNTESTVSAPLSMQAPPSQEFLRFNTRQHMSFAPSDVIKIWQAPNSHAGAHLPEKQWHMTIAFMGLTGAQGVLPYHLSETILRELKQKNSSLYDFLEIFNHRAVTMMYKAWAKYQIPASFETHKIRAKRGTDSATHALLSLMGLGLPSLQYRQPYSDESLIPLSGFLSRNTCTASGLASMIKTRFGLSAVIKQFTGSFSELTPDIMTRLGMQNNALGQTSFLGSRCYSCTGKFTVAITPQDHDEFDSLAPGSPLIRSLMTFIRQASGPELVFDVDVALCGERIKNTQLKNAPDYKPTLGWNTVLGNANKALSALSVRMSSEIAPPDDTLPMAS